MVKVKEKDTNVYGFGKGITYINGKYYMLSYEPAKVCVSEDLEEWTEYNLNSNIIRPKEIVYGNGIFVICGDCDGFANTYIYKSTNGTTWTPVKLNTTVDFGLWCNGLKFINNKFVLVTSGWHTTYRTDNVITKIEEVIVFFDSSNGSTWTRHEFVINRGTNVNYKNATAMDIDFYNNTYVYVGNNGNIYTSSNLNNWTKRNSGVSDKLVGITYGKGQFIVTGDNGVILTSKNGKTWAKQNSGTTSYLIRSRYAAGLYIAVGYNGVILQSIDGISWINIGINTGVRYGLAYNGSMFVITCGYYGNDHTIPIMYFDASRQLTNDDKDSSIFFFDKNLNMQGIIDYFISLRWRRKYFEAGEFEIVLPVNEYTKKLCKKDNIVMRNNYTEAGIIDTIEFHDDGTNEEMTISGRFLSFLLNRRIIRSTLNFNGNTIEGMNTIVNSMTPFTTQWETVQPQMDSAHIEFQATYKNVYDYMCRLSEFSNIGFRLVPNVDSKVFMFEAWAGKDRSSSQNINPRYTFSDGNQNIEQGSLVSSTKNNATYVLVGGEGEGSSRILQEVTKGKTGFDLYEIFSDQSSLSSDTLSTNEYKNQLKDIGNSLMCEETVSFEVSATEIGDYKSKWNLGDIVNIKKEKWGLETTKRIIEVEEVIEEGKKSIFPTFGSPLASAWNDD